jgi:hypothetical protein
MSNNVEPFTMIKITNPQPILLPWILRNLGLFRAEWFLTELEDSRDVPEAKLSGVRFNFKPHPAVELGISRVAMFGGRGMPRVDLNDYFKIFLARTEQDENNQLAGFDASLLLPVETVLPLRSIKIYADAGGEDEAGGFPSKWGELIGLQLNDIGKTGRTDLRIEYADNQVSGKSGLFYNHSVYTSGYSYEGRVIGHHMGADSRDVSVELSHYLTEEMLVGLAYDRQTHFFPADAKLTIDIFECGLVVFPSLKWRLETGYRYEDHDSADLDDNHIVQFSLIREF